ncbi:Syntaxin-18 [Mortierella sp. AM989]|nr:Syntaxin-18 [Mortierella sp. AM989]
MVSISAISAVQDTVNHHDTINSCSSNIKNTTNDTTSLIPTLSITSAAASDSGNNSSSTTATETHRASEGPVDSLTAPPPKAPTVLLPPVEIETKSIDSKKTTSTDKNDSNKENIDPLRKNTASPKPGVAKSKTSAAAAKTAIKHPVQTRKPLILALGRVTTAPSTIVKKPTSRPLLRPLTPPVAAKPSPATLRSTSSTTAAKTPTATARTSIATTRASTATAKPTTATSSATSKTLAPPSAGSSIRRSPSTPSLSSSSATGTGASPARNSTLTGRRVASSSGVETRSPQTSPAATPGVTRSSSQASIATASSSTKRLLASGSGTLTSPAANRITTAAAGASTARKTLTTSKNPSPSSTLKQPASRTTTRPTAATALASGSKTPIASSARSTPTPTPTRPVTDAAKVKMLSTQLNGLQEKHDQTLKLLQEQEERMRRELEELTLVPEPERKPIPSDAQDVLKEMEELRKQFNDTKTQHEKALEDLTAQHTLEVTQLKEAQEALLLAMTNERDTITESLKSVQESGELTERERDAKVKELEEQIEASTQSHNDAILKHAEALEALRSEIESDWTARHESKLEELTKEHAEQLKSIEVKVLASGDSKNTEIQDLKDSFAQQLKDLEVEHETRTMELIAKHESETQELKDKLANLSNTNEESVTKLAQVHAEAMDKLKAELQTVQEAKAELESELDRVRSENKDELKRVRAELEDALKQLALQGAETTELKKHVDELTADLENASMSTMLKNTKRYKVKNVQIYGSSVSGNLKIKRSQQSINDTLEQLEIEYEFVDVSADEDAKKYMRSKNAGERDLPQIFSGGEYRGIFDDFEYAVETHQLAQFLAFDREKGFVPRHKIGYSQPSGIASNAQDGDAEQGAGLPSVVENGLGNRSTAGASINGKNGKPDIGTSMYLISPASTRFRSPSSPTSYSSSLGASFKPGFVQTASQAWDGVLRDDITHAKHDLGFNSSVTPDDDELEELFSQGAVTDADLQAMLESSRTMADLRAFIITTRPAYLNISRGAGSGGIKGSNNNGGMRLPRKSDSISKGNSSTYNSTSSKVLNDLLDAVSSLTSLSDKDRDSIDTQAKVMMRQIKGAIEELESLEQERRKRQQSNNNAAVPGLNQLLTAAAQMGLSSGTIDDLAQHRQGVTLYLNERLASLATLHKDQYETRIAREMEKRESSLYKALPKPTGVSGTNSYGLRHNDTTTAGSLSAGGGGGLSQRRNQGPDFSSNSNSNTLSSSSSYGSHKADASGISSSQYYQQESSPSLGSGFVDEDQDFEESLTEQERQMLQLENESIVQKLETELNQVRQLESSMLELSSLHSTIQEHLEAQTLQTNRLHEEALTAIDHIDAGNDQLIKAGKHNKSTRKWILFFLIMASFVLLFLDWYD